MILSQHESSPKFKIEINFFFLDDFLMEKSESPIF